jgi:hypothetical protein
LALFLINDTDIDLAGCDAIFIADLFLDLQTSLVVFQGLGVIALLIINEADVV